MSRTEPLSTKMPPPLTATFAAMVSLKIAAAVRSHEMPVITSYSIHYTKLYDTVELAVAIHYVFKTPYDKLIWDVGHQAYAHKILTGRCEQFYTNRTYHGISGFPKMSESEYDAFGVGHSSTSISAALGMAVAAKLQGDSKRQHIRNNFV